MNVESWRLSSLVVLPPFSWSTTASPLLVSSIVTSESPAQAMS